MTEIKFPGLTIPKFEVKAGALIDVTILGIRFRIPWEDIVLWEDIVIWEEFTLFDTDWIIEPVHDFIENIGAGIEWLIDWTRRVILIRIGDMQEAITGAIDGVVDTLSTVAEKVAEIPGLIAEIPDAVRDVIAKWVMDRIEEFNKGFEKGLEEAEAS